MENLKLFAQKVVELMGFSDYRVEVDEERRRGSVSIYDSAAPSKENLPVFIDSFNHLVQLVAKKTDAPLIFFDINNYRLEREALIGELARTAARKVASTQQYLSLPVMNSYERRIVHTELAANPAVKTESVGVGRGRYVVIRPLEEKPAVVEPTGGER